jgi:16S rRNA (cytosine1402-N4)-methyltransferase
VPVTQPPSYHEPVLLREVLEAAQGARRVVDATLGAGGHAAAFVAAGVQVLGIDRDPEALAAAREILGSRIEYLPAAYSEPVALQAIARFQPEFILLDLGVSSHQLDEASRGFSFRPGAPLDMRMGDSGATAADILNELDTEELRRIFADYGDESRAGRLAQAVVKRRSRQQFATSDDLVNAIRAVLGPRSGPADFARLFQAVRIAVNDELRGLAHALPSMLEALVPGGGLAAISYHSGEDRIVKHAFQDWARACICPPGTPVCICRGRALGKVRPRKPVRPSVEEAARNPRARSAKLRVFYKADDV